MTWRRLNDLFQSALEREPGGRTAFLTEACAGEEALRRELERLLAAHGSATAFLERPPLTGLAEALAGDDEPAAGRQIGAYRILREIGRGGMAAVYLAERADSAYRKQVAVKLIKKGMDSDSVLRHFRQERQILASLEHPNIARLLDGGTTDDGSPYFVMEHIVGQPIDAWCAARRSPLPERLELFRQVCAAVSYAHQHLVVHRDIKPGNILVGADGVPKLLDFGIARLLGPDPGSEPAPTATGLRLMTPEYASPEQVQGLPVTTLTDVYSLGVVLYELLAGRAPYRFAARTPQEIARVICTAEPERPSAAAPRLHGDLDNIALKALRKDPQRRYASVDNLSQDVLRHLKGLPVTARPDTLPYRAAKFVRRHALAVGAGALLLLSLLGGILATAAQAAKAGRQEVLAKAAQARAERRFDDVRRMVHAELFDYHDAIKDLPGSTQARVRLVRDALAFLDGLAREAEGDLSLQLELAAGYERLGDVEADLGDNAGAIVTYRKAVRMREALVAARPRDVKTRRDAAFGQRKLANMLLETGDLTAGLALNRKALALFEALSREDPGNAELRYELGRSHDFVGLFLMEQGDLQGALTNYRRFAEVLESLPPDMRRTERIRRAVSIAYERAGMALLQLSDLPHALESNRKALALRSDLAAAFPLNTDYRRALAVSHYNGAEILARMDRPREALESYRRHIALSAALSAADPRKEVFQRDLAMGRTRMGNTLARLGDLPRAQAAYRQALGFWAERVKAAPSNLWSRAALIEAHAKISRTLAQAGQAAAAQAASRETLALIEGTHVEPANASIRGLLADSYTDLGAAYATLAARPRPAGGVRHWRTARGLYARGLAIWQDLRAHGLVAAIDAAKPDAAARDVARCDAAIGR